MPNRFDFASVYTRIDLSSVLDRLRLGTPSKWAVLLCKFSDDTAPTTPRAHYERLFTGSGAGSMNMTDFFANMSHGKLDLTGSQVFGWYTLPRPQTDYVGNVYPEPAGKLNRNGLFDLAKATATGAGVDLTKFDGVVVSMNGSVDLCGWVGGMAALCDSNSLQPSLLGQEMGHGYGLDHARLDGSTDDYMDPYDVMSTANAYSAANTDWTSIGPGLCASAMRSRGWLDETRVWSSTSSAFSATVELRPLHRHDLPGLLAAQVGQYLVELRVPERWDAAIPGAHVLVHHFDDNHSYLAGALTAGQSYDSGFPGFPYVQHNTVDVVSIDEPGHRATIQIGHRPAERPPVWEEALKLFGGIEVDGGGFIIVGGKIIKVPPRGPIRELVEHVAALAATSEITDVNARTVARANALENVAMQVLVAGEKFDPVRSPARHKRLKQGPQQIETEQTIIVAPRTH